MQEIKLYNSPWKAIKLIAGSMLFVVGGIWLLTSTDAERWIGWMSICFFGLCLLVGLYVLFDRRPQIIINEIGVWDRSMKQDVINWKIIHHAYLGQVNNQKFICLQIDESYEPSKKKGKWFKRMANMNKALGFQELNINLSKIKINEVRLTEFINAMVQADLRERKSNIRMISERGFE